MQLCAAHKFFGAKRDRDLYDRLGLEMIKMNGFFILMAVFI